MRFYSHKFAFIFLILGLTSVSVVAQVDLAGTWDFEKSTASIFSPNALMFDYQSRLVIKKTSSSIVIATKSHLELHNKKTGAHKPVFDEDNAITYYPDGREETNILADGTKVYSKTEWNSFKLKTIYFSGPFDDKRRKKLGVVEIELSKDHQKLVITRTNAKNSQAGIILAVDAEGKAMLENLASEIDNRKDTHKLISK